MREQYFCQFCYIDVAAKTLMPERVLDLFHLLQYFFLKPVNTI